MKLRKILFVAVGSKSMNDRPVVINDVMVVILAESFDKIELG